MCFTHLWSLSENGGSFWILYDAYASGGSWGHPAASTQDTTTCASQANLKVSPINGVKSCSHSSPVPLPRETRKGTHPYPCQVSWFPLVFHQKMFHAFSWSIFPLLVVSCSTLHVNYVKLLWYNSSYNTVNIVYLIFNIANTCTSQWLYLNISVSSIVFLGLLPRPRDSLCPQSDQWSLPSRPAGRSLWAWMSFHLGNRRAMWRAVTQLWPLEPPVFRPVAPPRCRWNNTGRLQSPHASRPVLPLSQRWVLLSLKQRQQCHLVASVGHFFFNSVYCTVYLWYAIQWHSPLLVCLFLFLPFWSGDHLL